MTEIPACKCCGGATTRFGEVQAARSCEDPKHAPFPPSDRMIAYQSCDACGFIFTTDFDDLSDAGMAEAIYNDDYVLADPEFVLIRPRYMAGMLGRMLAPLRPGLALLDYGAGAGLMVRLLREEGFEALAHDPFFHQQVLAGERFELVTAFEVLEHSRQPLDTLREASGFLAPGGALLFSTALRPKDATIDWPYIAPRNGHVSLQSDRSLEACARALGMTRFTLGEGLHLFTGGAAGLGRVGRFLVRRHAGAILYTASLRGAASFARAWARVAAVGGAVGWRRLLDPRHALRALR